MKSHLLNELCACVFILGIASSAHAATIFSHSGNADPTTEGWSVGGSGSIGIVVGPLTDDAGSGKDAWFVNDTSAVGGSNQSYFQLLTTDQSNQASAFGWSLSMTIRIPNASETAAYAPFALYRDKSVSWDLAFGSEANGDPIVLLPDGGGAHPNYTGLSYTLNGAGSTYHTYDLVYDPLNGSADLFVDGIERLSNYAGIAFDAATANVGWGSGSSIDTGQGNFNSVQFSITPVPLPAAVYLFGSGLVGLVALSRRKRDESLVKTRSDK